MRRALKRLPGGGRLTRGDGQSVVLFALMLPLLFVFAAFAVDAAHAFVDYRHLQNAADASALAAAQDVAGGGTSCATCGATATNYSTLNGFTPTGGLVVCSTSSPSSTPNCYQWPYVDSNNVSHSDEVLVRLSNCTPTLFGSLVGVPSICESVRSVARATPLTHTSVIPGTTTAATTLYSTSTNTSTTGGTPEALFAYAHGGTDPCTTTTGVVIGGNPQVSIDGVVSNGNVNNSGKGTVAFAGYGAPPTNSCGLTNTGGGTVSASQANTGAQNWPFSLTTAQRTTICSSAGATVHNGSTLSLSAGAQGIYCSDTAITMNGASGGGSSCTGEGVTLIAPIVTDPGNAAHADLCPSNLANTFGLTIWMYSTSTPEDFNFSHNNSSVNGIIWIQNGNLIYSGNSGSTGFYEAQNITISGNSYTMTGSGTVVNQTTTYTTTSTPTATIPGTTTGSSTQTSTTGTTIGLGE